MTIKDRLQKSLKNYLQKNPARNFSVRKFIMATAQKFNGSEGLVRRSKKDDLDTPKPSIATVILNLLHRFLGLCVRFIFAKIYGEHGQSMPPIKDLILLESATSIAEKIRTKKVS